jgi:hypothetical protein
MAVAFLGSGRIEEGIGRLEKAIRLNPDNAAATFATWPWSPSTWVTASGRWSSIGVPRASTPASPPTTSALGGWHRKNKGRSFRVRRRSNPMNCWKLPIVVTFALFRRNKPEYPEGIR